MSAQLSFIKEAVKTIKSSGAILPSSKWLTKRVVNAIDFSNARVIVEFGAGNGVFTKEILSKSNRDTKLVVFEVNQFFYDELLKIDDDRITVINGSADGLLDYLCKNGYENVDYIISSLPLTNMPKSIVNIILKEAYNVLSTSGAFLQYQYSLGFYKKLKSVFKNKISVKFEPFNFPPAFLYVCKK